MPVSQTRPRDRNVSFSKNQSCSNSTTDWCWNFEFLASPSAIPLSRQCSPKVCHSAGKPTFFLANVRPIFSLHHLWFGSASMWCPCKSRPLWRTLASHLASVASNFQFLGSTGWPNFEFPLELEGRHVLASEHGKKTSRSHETNVHIYCAFTCQFTCAFTGI